MSQSDAIREHLEAGRDLVSSQRAKQLLCFDPITGLFHWRSSRGRLAKEGSRAGGFDHEGYVTIKIDGRKYRAHRLAWLFIHGTWPDGEIDHLNGIRCDNRFANLRVASRAVNQQNKTKAHRNNSTGFLGVSPTGSPNRWKAEIKANGRKKYLGVFESAEAAHEAYLSAKSKLHPECAGILPTCGAGAALANQRAGASL